MIMKSIVYSTKKSNIKLDKFIFMFITVFLFLFNILIDFSSEFLNNIVAFLVMYISLYMTIRYRHNIIAFLMFFMILYFNYSIVFSRYLYIISNHYGEFYVNVNTKTYSIGIMILLIFMTAIYCLRNDKYKIRKYKKGYYFSDNTNILIVILMILLLTFINIFGFDRSGYGQRGATTALYEYAGVVFIFAYYYCGKDKYSNILKVIVSMILIGFCIQGFIYGERISGIQFLVIFFIFMLSHKMTYKSVSIVAVMGLLAMAGIGIYRGSYEAGSLTLEVIIDSLTDRMFTFDGGDLAYYTSLTFVMVHDINSFSERIILFLKFIASIFLGTSKVKDSFLAEYTRRYYMHWYGGIYPYVFYFYLGWIGTFISSVIAGHIIRYTSNDKKENKSFYKLLKIYIIAILPRWYMYSPQILLRGIFIFSIFIFIIKILNSITINVCNKSI